MSNTNDYINRGKAINAVNQRIKQIGYDNDLYVLSIRQAVRDVPATDVVEVVRCKDCANAMYTENGNIFCDGIRDANWFCADGERMSE